ncbi:ABC transporter permease [Haladaptatus salinisoli]|uniref:ABC transporter permease n=1 Tax=Haladaptatus salinisoli TaxID=2884876 RepID=UPI001D0AAAB8|nr:ABC transporter permease [Haladaptatus salinisoli]
MRWLAKRIGQAIFTLWAIVTISFVLIRFLPGGPIDYLVVQLKKKKIPESIIDNYVENYISFQPDQPLWVQYIDYVSSVLQGDLGQAYFQDGMVFDILAQALPWTIFLAAIATFVTTVVGIAFGGFMAYTEGSKFDSGVTLFSTVAGGIPYYILAITLVYLFGYRWQMFPTGGQVDPSLVAGFNWPYVKSVLYHAVLPLLSTTLVGWGGVALSMRGNSISILGEDYIRVARLRGLSRRRIALRYVARNAMLPMYTGILLSIAFMLGGSVILEQIFAYPGIGLYLFKAVVSSDYPLMMGGLIMISTAVVIGVLVADLTYSKIDPRASSEGERESY